MSVEIVRNDVFPYGAVDFTYRDNRIDVVRMNEQALAIACVDDAERRSFIEDADAFLARHSELAEAVGKIAKNVTVSDRFTVPVCVTRSDGVTAFIQADVRATSKNDGVYKLSAVLIDVTDSANAILRSNEKMNVVANLTADMIFEYSIPEDLFRLSVNDGNEFVLRREMYDFESEFKKEKIICENDIETFERFCDSLRLGQEFPSVELRLYDEDAEDYVWVTIDARTLFDANGKPATTIGRIRNISKNKEAEKRLIDKAERDPLTKIYNKATTKSLIKDYLRTDNRDTLDAMIIVDVDNFKAVNDNLGHLFGDSILVDLSQEMQDLFRSSDVVGRIGGDEFMVFLRGIKQKHHIEEKASDICRIFELLYCGEHEEKITGSLGISLFPQDGDTFEELFKKADIALYSSKNEGKNCFTFYSDQDTTYEVESSKIHVERYRRDVSLSASSNLFDNEITDFAFEIMSKTTDASSAVNLLLSKVGKHFKLSRVCVLEMMEEPGCMKYTYQWSSKGIGSQLGKVVSLNESKWEHFLAGFDENDIFMQNDLESRESLPYAAEYDEIISGIQARSLLQCALYDSGVFKGIISFHDCEKPRSWTVDEVRSLKTICKVISSYLLKMRAFQKANQLVDRLTNYDKLTNLPRSGKFNEMVTDYLAEADRDGRYALICCDINNFKYINEKYGSENGDRLLKCFSESLQTINAIVKFSSRVYSDKFTSLIKFGEDQDLPGILKKFFDDFSISERKFQPDINLSVACGIYYIEDLDGFDIGIAVDNVTIARKYAKDCGDTVCVVYSDEMKSRLNRSIEIVNQAKQALVNREFKVYYQPKIGLMTNTLVGAEALVRWQSQDGRLIPPNDFIPYLEKNGFITSIDFYVYEEVCRYIREHLDNDKPIVPISVNVSRVHLRDPEFLSRVNEIVTKYRIPAHLLEFELTESVFLENQLAAVATMEEMKKQGFLVSIDDFGSGFSSLNLLKSLPVDILKIDKEFFANDTLNTNDQIIISSIISMASRMNISVICEGVETKNQVQFLKENKCDMVQGFYYAKPISAEDFNEYSEHPDITQ